VLALASLVAVVTTVPSSPRGSGRSGVPIAEELADSCPGTYPTWFGQPAWVIGCHIGGQAFTSPVVGSIDGQKVVVDASLSGEVYVVNARTGKELPGWPQRATLTGDTATAIDSSPAIAYLNGPSAEPSIVVGLGSQYVKDQNGGVMAWNANGTVRFRFLTKKTFSQWGGPADYTNSVFASPAIGDLTGNGQQDIVFGSFDHYLYALNPSGKLLPGFPINRADTIWSSPSLVDVTHTGRMDIIEGGDATGLKGTNGVPCYSGWVSDYRYYDNAPHLIWERCLAETVWSSPAVTMFGSTPVVVVGTSWFYGPGRDVKPAEDEIFAFNAANGDLMKGWPVNTGGATIGSPAVGPAVPGGPTEVFESSCQNCPYSGDAIVTAWSQSGRELWRTNLTTYGELLSSPTLANVTNSSPGGLSSNDVLIGNVAGLYVLNAENGHKVAGTGTKPIDPGCYVGGAPPVAYVPGSATGWMLFTNCGFAGSTTVNNFLRAFNIPAPASAPPWPMFRGNPQRTGVADPLSAPTVSCTTPTSPSGYRLFTGAGHVYGYGGSHFCGSMAGEALPAPVAGVASAPNGGGYWVVLRDGTVYAFGDARYYGSLRGDRWRGGPSAPGAPVVGIASSRDGKGYLLLAGDGSVYAFGDATYHGSRGPYHVNGAPVGIVVDQKTGGYWIATDRGSVYNFDAPFYGSQTSGHASPIVGIAALHDGAGYWLATASGYVFRFGAAGSLGSNPGQEITGIAAPVQGDGYYLVSAAGRVFRHGSIPYSGSLASPVGTDPVIGIATP
jgi:hypothetical protein